MADVNKSVEITLRANIKQLQDSLESIPNMTKAEAQAMTRALSAEFNKAEKAAKKAAEESKKAAKATSAAYSATSKDVGASFDRMAQDASSSAQEIKVSFADAAGETNALSEGAETLGTSMGAATLAVDKLIPGLDDSAKKALEMADGLATAAEQAIKGGPVTMALTAAVVAGTAAYNLYTRSSRLAAEQQRVLAAAQEAANDKLDEQFAIVQAVTGDFKDANREYQLLTGQITQLEYDLAQARDISTAKTKSELATQQKRIQEQERLLIILDKAIKSTGSISAEETELLNQAMALSDQKLIQQGLNQSAVNADIALVGFRGELLNRIQKEKDFSNAIVQNREKVLEAEQAVIRTKAEIAKETKEEEQRQQQIAKEKQRQLEAQTRLQQIEAVGQALADQRVASEDRARQIFIDSLDPQQQIIEQTNERVRQNDLLQESIRQQIESAESMAKTDADRQTAAQVRAEGERAIAALVEERQVIEEQGEIRLQEVRDDIAEKNKKQIQEESDLRRKKIQEDIEALNMWQEGTIGTFSNTIQTMTTLAEQSGQKNGEIIKALFAAQRIAAVGEIAFNTAKAITAAGNYPPPFNGLMIAGAVAAGAAQTAAVFAQQAPKFHMGGMTPDESIAVVKSGEAVLDRATVNRLGGEPGVNRLQNGGSSAPQVIVTNPYKHFDRYMTDRQRAGLSMRSAKRGY
jgi:hypothetical protein